MSNEEKEPEWKQGNFNGPNEALVKLAENLAKAARLGIEEKLSKLKSHARAEASRLNHPVMDQFVKEIDKLKVT